VSGSVNECREGRYPALLLDYVEGKLAATQVRQLEDHLKLCSYCRAELESLRRVDALLKKHKDAFHPDEEELYRFAAQGHDPRGEVSSHLQQCEDCREAADLLREMVSIGAEIPTTPPEMPSSLRSRLGLPRPSARVLTGQDRPVRERLSDLFRLPFRAPALSLGTAAAILIIAAVSVPMWKAFKEVPAPVPATPSVDSTVALPPAGLRFKAEKHEGVPVTRGATTPTTPEPAPNTGIDISRPARVPSVTEKKKGRAVLRKEEVIGSGAGARDTAEKPPGAPRKSDLPESELFVSAGRTRDQSHSLFGSPAEKVAQAPQASQPAPVMVRIVDQEGRDIEWLKLAPRLVAGGRYEIVQPDEKSDKSAFMRQKAEPGQRSSAGLRGDVPKGGYLILVEVRQFDDSYDVHARLLELPANREKKQVEVSRLSRDQLLEKIDGLVNSLLGEQ